MNIRSTGPLTRPAARGLTLIEMVTSLGIVAVLLVASGSAVMIARRAVPERSSATRMLTLAAAASDRIAGEFTYAISIVEAQPTSLAFTIPDRTGDGVSETVRYAWSGTAGAPLTRTFNGGAPVNVLDDVRELSFVYDRIQEKLQDTYTESAETLLINSDPGGLSIDFKIDDKNWPAQYVKPSLPAGAAWWRITRVRVRVKEEGADGGETRVQMRNSVGSNLPGTLIYDQCAMIESTLDSNYAWKELTFGRNVRLEPAQGVCVVLQWISDADSCAMQIRSVLGSGYTKTTNAGASFSGLLGGMPIQVLGTTGTLDPPAYRYRLMDLRVTLRAGNDQTARFSATHIPLNVPEVAAP